VDKTFEVVHHLGATAIIALDEERRIALLHQYRHPIKSYLWEIPAGKLDIKGESPLNCAKRELTEETGLSATNWEDLGAIITSPGFCDEKIQLYLATDLSFGETNRGASEIMEMKWIPFEEALDMVSSGEINDAKTMAALLRVALLIKQEED
jgi:ADP-ribose pyrophosphatase